jgi:hypothetical protein
MEGGAGLGGQDHEALAGAVDAVPDVAVEGEVAGSYCGQLAVADAWVIRSGANPVDSAVSARSR